MINCGQHKAGQGYLVLRALSDQLSVIRICQLVSFPRFVYQVQHFMEGRNTVARVRISQRRLTEYRWLSYVIHTGAATANLGLFQ